MARLQAAEPGPRRNAGVQTFSAGGVDALVNVALDKLSNISNSSLAIQAAPTDS